MCMLDLPTGLFHQIGIYCTWHLVAGSYDNIIKTGVSQWTSKRNLKKKKKVESGLGVTAQAVEMKITVLALLREPPNLRKFWAESRDPVLDGWCGRKFTKIRG